MEPADLLVLRNYLQTMADCPSKAKQVVETASVRIISMICSCLQKRSGGLSSMLNPLAAYIFLSSQLIPSFMETCQHSGCGLTHLLHVCRH